MSLKMMQGKSITFTERFAWMHAGTYQLKIGKKIPLNCLFTSMDQVHFFSSFQAFCCPSFSSEPLVLKPFSFLWSSCSLNSNAQRCEERMVSHSALSESDRGWERKRENGPSFLSFKSLQNSYSPTVPMLLCLRYTLQIHERGSSKQILGCRWREM